MHKAHQIVKNYDFSHITSRAVKAGMPPEKVPGALAELQDFLIQCAVSPDVALAPQSQACDALWHEFIVADTRAYFRFCNAVYGEYLHHDGVTLNAETLAAARANSLRVFGAGNTEDDVTCGEVRGMLMPVETVTCGKVC